MRRGRVRGDNRINADLPRVCTRRGIFHARAGVWADMTTISLFSLFSYESPHFCLARKPHGLERYLVGNGGNLPSQPGAGGRFSAIHAVIL